MTRKLDFFHCVHWNGPLPMIGGLLTKLLAAAWYDIFDQMCSGKMGTAARLTSMPGAGCLHKISTCVSSTAVAFLTVWR